MFKKIPFLVVFLALSGSLAMSPPAAAAEPNGLYTPHGPTAIKLNAPHVAKVSLTSPDVAVLNALLKLGLPMQFSPAANGQDNFLMTINNPLDSGKPIQLHGVWSMLTSSRFQVDIDFRELIAAVQQRGGGVTITRNSFAGKVLDNGNLKGAYDLGLIISLPGTNMNLRAAGTYVATPLLLAATRAEGPEAVTQDSTASANAITLERFVLDVLEEGPQ
ncbi:hypothetical protein MCA2765 [Methylococcus capsulatus str. Bath]|uniref:Lipoprotein n=1 Tax=Methylococcus capsulatus (strain ATCC 33009 / NCIMB 11132 / Bath) TaxID=243233 RepID=Q603N8_METCA|nr:hypothetical protein [Methylococcus capsulatus]AAU91150.1 hypothetical protein MCA2765 [Methylococcus capsulatus str. Bath]